MTSAKLVDTVVTRRQFSGSMDAAWNTLMFYEQVETRPPLLLRMLLPTPIRTEGRKSSVGDEALCLYKGGHLVKRITAVDGGCYLAFDVIEQQMDVGRGMRLCGGWYALTPLPNGRTEVELATSFTSPRWPRRLFAPIEEAVCHLFHRHILHAMRQMIEQSVPVPSGAAL